VSNTLLRRSALDAEALVRARLSYVYSPMILKKEELNIKLGEVERVVY